MNTDPYVNIIMHSDDEPAAAHAAERAAAAAAHIVASLPADIPATVQAGTPTPYVMIISNRPDIATRLVRDLSDLRDDDPTRRGPRELAHLVFPMPGGGRRVLTAAVQWPPNEDDTAHSDLP